MSKPKFHQCEGADGEFYTTGPYENLILWVVGVETSGS